MENSVYKTYLFLCFLSSLTTAGNEPFEVVECWAESFSRIIIKFTQIQEIWDSIPFHVEEEREVEEIRESGEREQRRQSCKKK